MICWGWELPQADWNDLSICRVPGGKAHRALVIAAGGAAGSGAAGLALVGARALAAVSRLGHDHDRLLLVVSTGLGAAGLAGLLARLGLAGGLALALALVLAAGGGGLDLDDDGLGLVVTDGGTLLLATTVAALATRGLALALALVAALLLR